MQKKQKLQICNFLCTVKKTLSLKKILEKVTNKNVTLKKICNYFKCVFKMGSKITYETQQVTNM